MEHTTYLFIDGAYAQQIYHKAMESVFGEPGELDPALIAKQAGAFRTYYYDCPEDLPRVSEVDVEFDARLAEQEKFFAKIRSLRGVHLQLGTMKGLRRRSQKEVDVLLAVDMLTHGFNRNMTRAVLVAGDLDFRPIVEALVRGGIFVEIWYEKESTADELPWAADFEYSLPWHELWLWSSRAFTAGHSLPYQSHARPGRDTTVLRDGLLDGRNVTVHRTVGVGSCLLNYESVPAQLWLQHEDHKVLERYFEKVYGEVSWTPWGGR
jgi:uncharacterized LabA/DUF88 family protein